MDEQMAKVVAERRQMIREDAKCQGCGSTLASCQAQIGKDPTAPPWFGCCARGLDLSIPCRHMEDTGEMSRLLDEIAAGDVRTVEEVMLDQIPEYRVRTRFFRTMGDDSDVMDWSDFGFRGNPPD